MIDEKGRLFGKVNIIDLLVLLALIAVVVLLAVRLVGGQSGSAGEASPTPTGGVTPSPKPTEPVGTSLIEYTVWYSGMDPEMYQEIKKHVEAGDVQTIVYDGDEAEGTVIVGLEAEPRLLSQTAEDKTVKIFSDPVYLDVTFTLRSVTDNAESNAFWGQEVRIGRGFMVKTRYIEVWGTIMDCKTLEYYPPESNT